MPVSRRTLLFCSAVLALRPALAAAQAAGAPAVIEQFYGELLAVMKQGKQLGFDGRFARLAPAIGRTFDLGLMSRLSVGPGWTGMTPDQQKRFSDAFTRFTIGIYAQRFDEFSGERFEVDPTAAANASGVMVTSRLVKSNGEKVTLNYLMRQGAGGQFQAIDVFLSGTISELATKRSEYAAVLQSGGADALIRTLEQKAAALKTG